MSAFRFVDDQLVRVTSESEIEAVEAPLAVGDHPDVAHLRSAMDHLSSRTNPDFRNSVKESISAVEAACRDLVGDPKATLGQALKSVDGLHPAMRDAFSKLYGWTSDDGGIRHGLTDEAVQPGLDEAKFMLVACSAFVNFLMSKKAV